MPYRTLAEIQQEQSVDKIELIVQKVLAIPLEAWSIRCDTRAGPDYALHKQIQIFQNGGLWYANSPEVRITTDRRIKKFCKQVIKFDKEREKRQKAEAGKKRFTEIVDSLAKEL